MKRFLPWAGPAVLAAAVAPLVRGNAGDMSTFVRAGRTLLSPHWSSAFADPSVQVGPLQLAVYGSVGRSPVALSIVVAVTVALVVVSAARAAGVERPVLLVLTGVAAVATDLTSSAYDSGHPADTLLPLLWVVAAAAAQSGRVTRAGILVGLSAGLETWGLLGVSVLALAPSRRGAQRGAAAAALAAATLFLPFAVTGHFHMASYTWRVSSGTLFGLVVSPGAQFGWSLRLLQAALAIGAGAVVARRTRVSGHALWLVPLVTVGVRLLLDPLDNLYYFAGLQALGLVALALVAARGLRLRSIGRAVTLGLE